jgi:hypothetical protein
MPQVKAYQRLFPGSSGIGGGWLATSSAQEQQGLVSGLRGVDGVLLKGMRLTCQLEFKIKKALKKFLTGSPASADRQSPHIDREMTVRELPWESGQSVPRASGVFPAKVPRPSSGSPLLVFLRTVLPGLSPGADSSLFRASFRATRG